MCIDVGRGERMREGRWWVGGGVGLFVGFGKEGWWVDGSGCSVGCMCMR